MRDFNEWVKCLSIDAAEFPLRKLTPHLFRSRHIRKPIRIFRDWHSGMTVVSLTLSLNYRPASPVSYVFLMTNVSYWNAGINFLQNYVSWNNAARGKSSATFKYYFLEYEINCPNLPLFGRNYSNKSGSILIQTPNIFVSIMSTSHGWLLLFSL